MKHINTFKIFEELQKSTFLSAADKLKAKGHENRADKLKKHADEIVVNQDEYEFFLVGSGINDIKNPKTIIDVISELKIKEDKKTEISKPKRNIIDKVKGTNKDNVVKHISTNYELIINFKKSKKFTINLGTHIINEFYGGAILERIQFKDRKMAYRFVKLCNDFMISEVGKSLPNDFKYKKLVVNDFYKK